MAGMLEQLTTILESELKNYKTLLELSTTKKEAIIKDDIDKIKSITDQENLLIGKNQMLEKKRTFLMDDIALVLNKDKEYLTLTNLIKLLETQPQEQSKLKYLSEEFKKTIDRLREANNQNSVLINQALEFIDFNINVVQSMQSLPPVSYNYGGKYQTEGRNFFDAKQ